MSSIFSISFLFTSYTLIWGYKQEKDGNLGLVFMICDEGKDTCWASETKEKQ